MATSKGGEFTKKDAVELIGNRYYCNEDKHVGDVLSRMVNAQFIIRVKPGHFKLSPSRSANLKAIIDPNQKELF